MNRAFVTMVTLLALGCGQALAADAVPTDQAAKEKQMEKLGALRARIMLKMGDIQKLVDNSQNGGQAAYNNVQWLQTKIAQTTQKAAQEENAKPQEMRNQAVLDNATKKSQRNAEMWQEFYQKDWTTFGQKMADPSQSFAALTQVFTSVANIEMVWTRSNLDLELLTAVMTAVDKRADELKVQTTAILADLNKTVATWEAFAKE